MNRRWMIGILALFGARKAAGQRAPVCIDESAKEVSCGAPHVIECKDGECNWVGPPPPQPPVTVEYEYLPNQCPVCATVAEPYVVKEFLCAGNPQECFPAKERIARCKRCSAAFFQDAVK